MEKNLKIPKVIHYCWFGRKEIPKNLQEYMKTWKEKCPEYEIVEWNEDNYDVNCCKYSADAYSAGKYAFVSDVARLWAVYNYGGIYLDTDVLLNSSIDELLSYSAWFASDNAIHINTGVGFGAKKGNKLVKAILDDYNDKEFTTAPCIHHNTKVIKKFAPGIVFNKTQVIDDVLFVSYLDYSKYATHMYNSKLTTEALEKQKSKSKIRAKLDGLKWKMFVKMQVPSMIRYCDTHTNIITKLYMYFVYDFWFGGFKSVAAVLKNKFRRNKEAS